MGTPKADSPESERRSHLFITPRGRGAKNGRGRGVMQAGAVSGVTARDQRRNRLNQQQSSKSVAGRAPAKQKREILVCGRGQWRNPRR